MELTDIDRAKREARMIEKGMETLKALRDELEQNRTVTGAWLRMRYDLLIGDMTLELGKARDGIVIEEIKERLRRLGSGEYERADAGDGDQDRPAESADGMPADYRREEAEHEPRAERAAAYAGGGGILEDAGRIQPGDPGNAAGNGVVESALRRRYRQRQGLRDWQRVIMEHGGAEEVLRL